MSQHTQMQMPPSMTPDDADDLDLLRQALLEAEAGKASLSPQILRRLRQQVQEHASLRRHYAQLLQRQQAVEAVIEGTTDAVFIKDTQGRYLLVNTACGRVMGRPVQQILGRDDDELFGPEAARQMRDMDQRVMTAGQALTYDEVVVSASSSSSPEAAADAGPRNRLTTKAPYRDAQGRILGVFGISRDITDRKRAEAALQESEERLRAFLDNSAVIGWLKDEDGRHIFLSRNYEKRFNVCLDQWKGKTDFELWPREVAEGFRRNDEAVLASGGSMEVVERATASDGKETWWLSNKFAFRDASGKRYVGGLAVDITRRMRAEEALRESERQLRFVCESIPHMVWSAQPDGNIDYVNQRVLDYTGTTQHDVAGWDWLPFIHPEDRQRTAEYWTNALRDGSEVRHRYRMRNGRSGEYRWYAVHALPLRDGQGRIIRWYGTCTDIDEQQRAEEALRQSEAQFHDLAEAMPQLVWIARPDGYHEYFNTGCRSYLGMSFDQLAGTGWLNCLHPDDRQRALERWDHSLKSGEPYEIEYRLRRASDGAYRWFLGRALPVRDEQGRIIRWFGTCTDIEDQKRAEEALRESEHRLRLAQQVARVGTFDWSLQADDDVWTPELEGLYGLQPGEFTRTGKAWADLIHPEDRAKAWQLSEQSIATGEPATGEWRVVWPDGSVHWLAGRWQVFKNPSGKPLRMTGVNIDITERKRAEAALRELSGTLEQRVAERTAELRESNERLKKVLEVETVGVMFWDLTTGRMTDANDTFLKMMGYSRSEVEAGELTWQRLTPPEYTEASLAEIRKFQATGRVGPYEKEYLRKDGTRQWLVFAGSSLGSNTCVEFCVDIAERKRAEEALRESESRLKLAYQAAKIGAFEWNVHTDVNTWTPELEAMYGLAPGTFGRTEFAWEQLVHPADRAATLERVQQAFATGDPAENEWRVIWPDGSVHWIMGRFQVQKDASGKPLRLTGVNIDITERKQAEATLRELNETLEHRVADRTEALRVAKAEAERANTAKDQFLAVLSHELRTPLTPVLPVLEELAGQVPQAAREDVEMARRNVELEARLIDDLLDVTRISQGKIELHRQTVELCTVLRRAAEVCAPDIEARRLHFGIQVEGGPYAVDADPARLQQVFWNLVKNAIKFTPHGGCVGIHCRMDGNEHVLAQVQDSGMGMEPAALARIFNAFEQTDRAVTRQFGGLGLGLAISKALVELHGGTISAHSEGKGKGAAFTVRLPICKVAEGDMPAGAEPGHPATVAQAATPVRPLRILLVEDHGDTARIMRRMLKARGHEVETAGDVATALELARQKPFDLLLSDLGLPDASGLDLMRRLVAEGKRVPAIALSGYGREQDIAQSREAGFSDHLIKPVNMEQLARAMVTVTGQRSASRPSLGSVA